MRNWEVKDNNKWVTMKQDGYQNECLQATVNFLKTRLNHPDILQHVNWVLPLY